VDLRAAAAGLLVSESRGHNGHHQKRKGALRGNAHLRHRPHLKNTGSRHLLHGVFALRNYVPNELAEKVIAPIKAAHGEQLRRQKKLVVISVLCTGSALS